MRRTGRAPRVPTRTVIYRTAAGLGADCAGIVRRGRMFLNTRHPLPVGRRVHVVLRFGAVEERLEGWVARVSAVGNDLNEMPGMLLVLDVPSPSTFARLWRLALVRPSSERRFGSFA